MEQNERREDWQREQEDLQTAMPAADKDSCGSEVEPFRIFCETTDTFK